MLCLPFVEHVDSLFINIIILYTRLCRNIVSNQCINSSQVSLIGGLNIFMQLLSQFQNIHNVWFCNKFKSYRG